MSCGMRYAEDRRSYAYSYVTREEPEAALDTDEEEEALSMEEAVESESEECAGVEYCTRLCCADSRIDGEDAACVGEEKDACES
jgi:hypothetical protein